jgi:phosphatidylglycerophosphate synthase
MRPEVAVIRSMDASSLYSRKICGLFPLERNILILWRAGVRKIYLDLSEEEHEFYNRRVRKHLRRIDAAGVIQDLKEKPVTEYLLVPSNIFMQVPYIANLNVYYRREGEAFVPIFRDDHFLLNNENDFSHGEDLVKAFIIENTGGYIAKKINKRISIPISLVLSKTRIHPNYLTALNMIIGFFSAFFLFKNTYGFIVLGGFFFQLASIFDGVDGEVAKFTFKVSKLGGWLDTISDNGTLLLFLIAISYLFFINFSGYLAIIIIVLMFLGLIVVLLAMIEFLRKCSDSGSLVAYDREFLQKLPAGDPLVSFVHRMKYITKKEFFALFLFLICFTGRIDLIIPVIAIVVMLAAVVLQILNLRYLKDFLAAGKGSG